VTNEWTINGEAVGPGSEGNLNLFVQCVARNASGREAARGAVLTITDHQRQFDSSYTEDLANCVRHLVDELGRGPVRWPPDPGDPVAWRDRLIGDHLAPLIQRDTVALARKAALDECGKAGKSCRIIGAVCADGSGR